MSTSLSPLELLPNEILIQIFCYLPNEQVGLVRLVCKRFNEVIKHHADYMRFNINRENLLQTSLTKPKITTIISPCTDDYIMQVKSDEDQLESYASWSRTHQIFYAIKEKTIFSGESFPLQELLTTASNTDLVWIKTNSRFITTINEDHQVDVYYRNPVRLLNSFQIPDFSFVHLVDNHLFLVDQHKLLRKWDLSGNEVYLVESIFIQENITLSASEHLLILSRGNVNSVFNLETLGRTSLNFPGEIERFESDSLLVRGRDGRVYRMVKKNSWARFLSKNGFCLIGTPLTAMGLATAVGGGVALGFATNKKTYILDWKIAGSSLLIVSGVLVLLIGLSFICFNFFTRCDRQREYRRLDRL